MAAVQSLGEVEIWPEVVVAALVRPWADIAAPS